METDELNEYIRKLNAGGDSEPLETATETIEGMGHLRLFLEQAVQSGATDLLMVPSSPPIIRLHGQLVPLEGDPLGPEDASRFFVPLLSRERQRRFTESGSVDLSMTLAGIGRFRINLHRTRAGTAAALRLLPKKIPSVVELGLPRALEELTRLSRGLVLITGPTGCGKSTTLAALIETINNRDRRHVITIEDPVEYEHLHRKSIVEQIEVGSDASSFADALRSALRQDPDVILVGEMRDLETVRTALTAAETGHLVLTTVHTNDAAQTIHRIVDVFPAEQQPQIRQQLAMALSAIVYQQLMPRKTGHGRVLACEVLIANDPVRNHIRKAALHHLHSEMTLGRKLGMMTLEDSLAQLVRADLITQELAELHATFPDELATYLKGNN